MIRSHVGPPEGEGLRPALCFNAAFRKYVKMPKEIRDKKYHLTTFTMWQLKGPVISHISQ